MWRRRRYQRMPVWLQPSQWPAVRLLNWLLGDQLQTVRLVDEFRIKRVLAQVYEHRKVRGEVYFKSRFSRVHGNGLKHWTTTNFYIDDLEPLCLSVQRVWSNLHEGLQPTKSVFDSPKRPDEGRRAKAAEAVGKVTMREIDHKSFGPFKGVLYAQELTGVGTVGFRIDLVREGPVEPGDARPVYDAASWWADAIPFEIDVLAMAAGDRKAKPLWSPDRGKERATKK